MRDQFDDEMYQSMRGDLNAGLSRLIRSVAHAFDRLQARLYDAPWDNEARRGCERRKTKFTAF